MKKQLIKSILFLLIITVTTAWFGHNICHFIENNKYEFSNSLDSKKTENQTENRIDTEFIHETVFLIIENIKHFETKNMFTLYHFNSKEILIEKIAPPPEVA